MSQTTNRAAKDLIDETAEIVHKQAQSESSDWLTKLVSVLALLFSAVSLYQTVIKQADLNFFVPESISYTQDANGSYEVFIVPLAIANTGANDGVISSLTLKVKNIETGRERLFYGSFIADSDYFSAKRANNETFSRPKKPYTPVQISGRSGQGRTILFYPRKFDENRVVKGNGTYEVILSSQTKSASSGLLDILWPVSSSPIKFSVTTSQAPASFESWILSGNLMRLFVQNSK